METFETYLRERKRMQPASVKHYQDLAERFIRWLQSQNILPDQAATGDILDYLAFQQSNQVSQGVQRMSLTAIRHYFNYLTQTGSGGRRSGTFNPATGLYLRNKRKTLPIVALPVQTLQNLYEQYPVTGPASLKDKVITGLLVYQGLAVKELALITLKCVDLQKGQIQIPSQNRINGRVLKLDAAQIYYLQRLIEERGLSAENDLLLPLLKFPSNYYQSLLLKLQRICPQLQNLVHIRQSVIQHWSKQHDIRLVQQMAGHRWISSTQRYDIGSLETLKAEIQQLHPLDQNR